MTPDEIEAIAEQVHARRNSGVADSSSPLTWKSEEAPIRKWYCGFVSDVLAVLDPETP